jgi:hypothetical protein
MGAEVEMRAARRTTARTVNGRQNFVATLNRYVRGAWSRVMRNGSSVRLVTMKSK